jgi:hypothetical protein
MMGALYMSQKRDFSGFATGGYPENPMSEDWYADHLKAEIAKLRTELELLEEGKILADKRAPCQSEGVRILDQIISIKRTIGMYQSILSRHESSMGD